MTVGVVMLLSMLEPRGGDPYSTGLTVWIISAAGTVALISGLVLLGRRRAGRPRPRCSVLPPELHPVSSPS